MGCNSILNTGCSDQVEIAIKRYGNHPNIVAITEKDLSFFSKKIFPKASDTLDHELFISKLDAYGPGKECLLMLGHVH